MLNPEGEPTAFGLTYRQHDNRQMQHILRAYNRLPENPTVRSAVYLNLVFLEKTLEQGVIDEIQEWMRGGGIIKDFPAPALAPAPNAPDVGVGASTSPQEQYRDTADEESEDDSESRYQLHQQEHEHDDRNHGGHDSDIESMDYELDIEALDHEFDNEHMDSADNEDMDQADTESPGPNPESAVATLERQIDCCICMETYGLSRFPATPLITTSCIHADESIACVRCIRETIRTSLRDGAFHRITCPLCPSKLSSEEIKVFASKEMFSRYEYLKMMSTPGLVMCLGIACGLGQIHEDGGTTPARMTCNSCGFKTCVVHKLPWHEGFTCEEYDMDESQIERLEADEATAKLLSQNSKICPTCGQGVTKEVGCDHLACRCGEEWCFVCLASWENIIRVGATAHGRACNYHPDTIRLGANQTSANASRMTELVHGGPVSEALQQARVQRNAARVAQLRPLAAQAAERRIQAMLQESGRPEKTPEKRKKVKLAPAWEER